MPTLSRMEQGSTAGPEHPGVAANVLAFLRRHRSDLICMIVLVALCGSLRAVYQSESATDTPIRADAARYVFAAANLRLHGDYSIDRPGPKAPMSRTDIAPGYPLFLTSFIE